MRALATQNVASHSSASLAPRCGVRRARVQPCRAADQQQQQAAGSADQQQQQQASTSAPGRVVREFRAFGGKVLEADGRLTGPEDQPDFWEGEKFDGFGKAVERYFLPGLVVLGLVCGGIAARTYEGGATAYIKTPSSPDDEMAIIDKGTVDAVLSGATPAPSVIAGDQ